MVRSLEGIWRAFTGALYDGVGPERFDVFIRNARPVTLDEDTFVFHFENPYARDKIETLLRESVTTVAQRSTNRRVRVVFEVDPESFSTARTSPLREAPRPRRPEATFGSFVSGPGNRMALEAARTFALGGPRAPRMLLVVASSGLGKSHLLRAIHAEMARRPQVGALHFTGDQFRRHFTWAYHRGHTEAFLKKCRGAGALLFDDLHLLAGKEQAQLALADVLEALDRQGARVALTTLTHPRRQEGFASTLRKHLRADQEVSIDRPDPPTGLGVLRDASPPGVPQAVLECLALQIQTSHKDQLQVLSRILESPPATVATARSAVSEFLNQWSQGLTYSDIVRIAALSFGVRVSEIYAAGRSRTTADARHACFYLVRKLLGEPYERIGDHFGGRDHATVLQACQRMEQGRGPLRDRLRRLERSLADR